MHIEYSHSIQQQPLLGYAWTAYITWHMSDAKATRELASGYALTIRSAMRRIDKAIASRRSYARNEIHDIFDDSAIIAIHAGK